MGSHNRKCCVDGVEYDYCTSCPTVGKHVYMSFCSDNCKDIYEAVSEYNMKMISRDEARSRLSRCDLSRRGDFTPATKRLIAEIMRGEVKVKKPVETVETGKAEEVRKIETVKQVNTYQQNLPQYRKNGKKKKR